jgi:hypothetical protein
VLKGAHDSGLCVLQNTHAIVYTSRYLKSTDASPPIQRVSRQDLFCLVSLLSRHDSVSNNTDSWSVSKVEHLSEALRMLLLNPWWSRMWVFQEAIVCWQLVIHRGGAEAPWDMFVDTARASTGPLSRHRDLVKVWASFSKKILDIHSRREAWAFRDAIAHNEPGTELLAFHRASSVRQAYDDRDKVFALVELLPPHPYRLVPDYSLSTRAVYIGCTRYIITSSQTLGIVCGDLVSKSRSDLPSWALDWSATVEEYDVQRTKILIDNFDAT